ncbi:MAG: O-antigen ligase family protein [Ketobacter sp.]|nr:O-antigen ligase family protein [Ketobacter sp.]
MAFTSHTAWAFMLYQFIYFMNPLGRWWSYMIPSISYSFFTVILMLIVFTWKLKEHSQNRLMAAPQFKWIFMIAAGYAIASSYASLPSVHSDATINFIKMVVILSVAYKLVDTSNKLDGILYAYIAGTAYIGYLAYQVGRDSTGRVEGIGTVDAPDSNGIAAAIAPSAVLCLYFFWIHNKKLAKFSIAVAGAFIANAIVLINSRASFLAIIGGNLYFLAYMFFSSHQRTNQKSSAVAVVFMGLIAASFLIDQTAIERFLSIKEQEMTEEQQTGATRVFFWIAAMDMAKDHPFGAGAAGFEAHAPEYLPEDMDTGFSRNRSVHSTWFEALTDLGYPGIFMLIMLLYSSFWATRQTKKELARRKDFDNYYKVVAIEGALISFIIAMSFMNRFRAELLYWCVLFTACAYNIYVVKQIAEEEPANSRRRVRQTRSPQLKGS